MSRSKLSTQPSLCLSDHFQPDWLSIEDVPLTVAPRTVVSLFSGAGGLDLGLELAGFETAACIEVDPHCRQTLRENRPGWTLVDGSNRQLPGDIRQVSGQQILDVCGMNRGQVAILAGGPPCQSFSNLGLKRGSGDPVNGDLFLHYSRILEEVLPRSFIFENVEGFAQSKHEVVRHYLAETFERLGYSFAARVLVAADYGDPQLRRRFVMIGIRGTARVKMPAPTHFTSIDTYSKFFSATGLPAPAFRPYRTVGETLREIPEHVLQRPDNLVMGVSQKVAERMKYVKQGQNFKVIPQELLPDCWTSGLHQGADTFGRLREDRPSVTIRTCAYNSAKGRYIHPWENRGLSTAEMAALQSFPSEWRFKCDGRLALVAVGRMVGNAVPIKLAEAIGLAVRRQLTTGDSEALSAHLVESELHADRRPLVAGSTRHS